MPNRPFRDEPTEVLETALGLADTHAQQAARFQPEQSDDELPAVARLFRTELQHREGSVTMTNPPDDERRDRYAAAMAKRDGDEWPTELEDDERNYRRRADAAMAVADAEQAPLSSAYRSFLARLEADRAGHLRATVRAKEAGADEVLLAVSSTFASAFHHAAAMAVRAFEGPDAAQAYMQRTDGGEEVAVTVAAAEPEGDLATARETNRRLNYEKQQLESELAAYRRAVGQWEISDSRTYVPLRTLAVIAKAAGRNIETPQWLLHYRRVEQAEATIERVRGVLPFAEQVAATSGPGPATAVQAVADKLGAALGAATSTSAQTADWDMAAEMPAPGESYRHYKGGLYTVIAVAEDTGTGATVVVYHDAQQHHWTRPLAEFAGTVAGGVRRFTLEGEPAALPAPADRAAVALAEVRCLCEMTIEGSVRVDAIHQARDTLAVIDRRTANEAQQTAGCSSSPESISPEFKDAAGTLNSSADDQVDCVLDERVDAAKEQPVEAGEGELRCPRCGESLTSYFSDDLVYRTGDDRPYCSGECVVAAHRADAKRQADTAGEA